MSLLIHTISAKLGSKEAWVPPASKTWMKILPVAPGYAFGRKPEKGRMHRTEAATATTVAFWRQASRPARITNGILPRQM